VELTPKQKQARELVCLALDLNSKQEILDTVEELKDLVGYFKLNSAFTSFGPELIKEIKQKGAKIFLDLKFHDIPNTLANYAEAAVKLDIDMFNVHIAGGKEMMQSAIKKAEETSKQLNKQRPKIIGVTILTSINQDILSNELNIQEGLKQQVLNFAKLANESGLDGIVCSSADLDEIKDKFPENFLFVTPGVKGVSTPAGEDQKRVFSPANAVKAGSSLLVIGRAILAAPDRKAAALEILEDIGKVL